MKKQLFSAMHNIKNIIFILIFGCIFSQVQAEKIKHAFVLVDVSGSMKNESVNQEAKKIVKEILLGTINLENYSDWILEKGINGSELIDTPYRIINDGSYLNIFPFGDKHRYMSADNNFIIFTDARNTFDKFFNSKYNFRYRDQNTYINIAKARVAQITKEKSIEKCYMIVVSDDLQDQTGSEPYTIEENNLLDAWTVEKDRKVTNIGLLKIIKGNKVVCKIEMQKVAKFDKPDVRTDIDKTPVDLQIPETPNVVEENHPTIVPVKFSPKGTFKKPIRLTTDNRLIKWSGGEPPYTLTVRNVNNKKSKTKSTSANNWTMDAFDEGGTYSIEIIDKNANRDISFYELSSGFPWGIVLILALLVIAAYLLKENWDKLTKLFTPKKDTSNPKGYVGDFSESVNNDNSKSMDW